MWKRTKKTLGEYVKYSIETAQENPQMILREYEYLTKEIEKEIETVSLWGVSEYIQIPIESIFDRRHFYTKTELQEIFLQKFRFLNTNHSPAIINIYLAIETNSEGIKNLLVHPEIIQKHLDSVKEIEKNIGHLQLKLKLIEIEKEQFKKRFIKEPRNKK